MNSVINVLEYLLGARVQGFIWGIFLGEELLDCRRGTFILARSVMLSFSFFSLLFEKVYQFTALIAVYTSSLTFGIVRPLNFCNLVVIKWHFITLLSFLPPKGTFFRPFPLICLLPCHEILIPQIPSISVYVILSRPQTIVISKIFFTLHDKFSSLSPLRMHDCHAILFIYLFVYLDFFFGHSVLLVGS